MKDSKENQVRIAALEILSLMEENTKIWENLDYFKEHSSILPRELSDEDLPIDQMELGEIINLCLSIKQNIHYHENKIAKFSNPESLTGKELKAYLKSKKLLDSYQIKLKQLIKIRDEAYS